MRVGRAYAGSTCGRKSKLDEVLREGWVAGKQKVMGNMVGGEAGEKARALLWKSFWPGF